MKILIVDDDAIMRRLLQVHLTRAGHEVVEATDGKLGLAAWQDGGFRLVISDWTMPEMDGVDLIRHIRQAGAAGYTYIILLTARGGKDEVVSGLESGADDYLTKPFHPGELRARVAIGERILNLESRLTEANAQLEELATHDGLTGLFNRRAFDSHLADELRRAGRYRRPVSLIMADIDYFKKYNDTHGHPQGDGLLRQMSALLRANVRETDFVARYGGEEFSIILPETDRASAVTVAEKIRQAVLAHPFLRGQTQPGGQITLSLGVASYLGDSIEPGDLLHWADEALYRAKNSGRNRVM